MKRDFRDKIFNRCSRPSVFAQVFVRSRIRLHVKHQRYVGVLHDSNFILDFSSRVLVYKLQCVHDISNRIINSSTGRRIPEFGRLDWNHVDDF